MLLPEDTTGALAVLMGVAVCRLSAQHACFLRVVMRVRAAWSKPAGREALRGSPPGLEVRAGSLSAALLLSSGARSFLPVLGRACPRGVGGLAQTIPRRSGISLRV